MYAPTLEPEKHLSCRSSLEAMVRSEDDVGVKFEDVLPRVSTDLVLAERVGAETRRELV